MPNQDHGGHAPGYFKHWTLQARTLLLNRSRKRDDQDVLGLARHRHDEEVASVDPPLGALMCVNVRGCLVEKQAHVARKVLDECGERMQLASRRKRRIAHGEDESQLS